MAARNERSYVFFLPKTFAWVALGKFQSARAPLCKCRAQKNSFRILFAQKHLLDAKETSTKTNLDLTRVQR
jgi:hypothetical protein